MRDRQPTEPGRVLIAPENGEQSFYATLTMADNPTDLGTPPTKNNLLSDETEIALFGAFADRTVNEAFFGISNKLKLIMSNVAEISVSVQTLSGVPLSGVHVRGIIDENGDDVYTNGSGIATGYIPEGDSVISVTGYADLENASKTLSVIKGASYSETMRLSTRNFLQITESESFRFSENVSSVDVSVGGGGGSGACGSGGGQSVGGGGGGYSAITENAEFEHNVSYPAVVGAGGDSSASRNTGKDGGTSSFLGVTAIGGKGGTFDAGGIGNGNGGYDGSNGGNGTSRIFTSFSEDSLYGGGGGGAWYDYGDDTGENGSGGSPAGGNGALGPEDAQMNGTDGLGGGGGGLASTAGYLRTSGAGGNGVIAIRMHLITS